MKCLESDYEYDRCKLHLTSFSKRTMSMANWCSYYSPIIAPTISSSHGYDRNLDSQNLTELDPQKLLFVGVNQAFVVLVKWFQDTETIGFRGPLIVSGFFTCNYACYIPVSHFTDHYQLPIGSIHADPFLFKGEGMGNRFAALKLFLLLFNGRSFSQRIV